MRVVAGEQRGRQLRAPRGRSVRPTSDRAREAVFARLGDVEDADVLDLFAGSGAMGIEALSRGAATCLFADVDGEAMRCVESNLDALDLRQRARLARADFRRVLRREERAGRRFHLLVLDPPYRLLPAYLPALRELVRPVLTPDARVVLEAPTGTEVDLGLATCSVRAYGAAALHLMAL